MDADRKAWWAAGRVLMFVFAVDTAAAQRADCAFIEAVEFAKPDWPPAFMPVDDPAFYPSATVIHQLRSGRELALLLRSYEPSPPLQTDSDSFAKLTLVIPRTAGPRFDHVLTDASARVTTGSSTWWRRGYSYVGTAVTGTVSGERRSDGTVEMTLKASFDTQSLTDPNRHQRIGVDGSFRLRELEASQLTFWLGRAETDLYGESGIPGTEPDVRCEAVSASFERDGKVVRSWIGQP